MALPEFILSQLLKEKKWAEEAAAEEAALMSRIEALEKFADEMRSGLMNRDLLQAILDQLRQDSAKPTRAA